MDFHDKLQDLRKQKGLTQQELADQLYVSRTAVSKWESGRGYPNIDSLKAIAAFFSVTVDDLLSGGQVLTIAEEEHKHTKRQICDLVFGLLDCSAAMFLFLPLFGQKAEGIVSAVSLLSLTAIEPYLKVLYFTAVLCTVICGILTLALQNCHQAFWQRHKGNLSLLLNGVSALLFIVSMQPYVAVVSFFFLVIKVFTVLKLR